MNVLQLLCKEFINRDIYEAELAPGGEADLHGYLSGCTKNPGHNNFIPVNKFEKEDLPEEYQNEDVVQRIRWVADMTVRVSVRYTSNDRCESDPFHTLRGRDFLRTGSGVVIKTSKVDHSIFYGPCPCVICVSSSSKASVWQHFAIITASHVVFDETEAKHTEVDFFYDSNEVQSMGFKVAAIKWQAGRVKEDWSLIHCASHDPELLHKVQQITDCWDDDSFLTAIRSEITHNNRLAVVVSHPHGCSKQISIGKLTEEEPEENTNSNCCSTLAQYTYTTPTCRGSSGAPVFVPARYKYYFKFFSCLELHSMALRNGFSQSSITCGTEIKDLLPQRPGINILEHLSNS